MTIAIIVTACLIILPGPGSEISSFYSNWTTNITVIIATSFSILTTIRAHRIYRSASKNNSNYRIEINDESDSIRLGIDKNT